MFDRVMRLFRKKIQSREYVVTVHANEEMDDDSLSVFDVESTVLSGTIVERQRDRATREHKYVVHGEDTEGVGAGVVAKLGPTGRMVIITVFRL